MALSTTQIQTIKATVPVLAEHIATITTHFYHTLLTEVPALKSVFNHSHQATGHQAQALGGALYAYATNIENLAVLDAFVERMCNKHVSLYVQPEQYDVVGIYLLRSMKEVLGDACTPEILDAWGVAYKQLADLMIAREKAMYAEQQGWTEWRELVVAKKQIESSEITSFYLQPRQGDTARLPSYRPGQYVSVRLPEIPGFGHAQSRQYSLSDAPGKGYYRISVKRHLGVTRGRGRELPGAVSNLLHDGIHEGDILQVSHPAGDFFMPDSHNGSVVLISAGVGLTPVMSMLNSMDNDSSRRVSWIHGTRDADTHAFDAHIRALTAKKAQFQAKTYHSTPSEGRSVEDQTGRINIAKLDADQDLLLNDQEALYYVCGPSAFMKEVHEGLRARGVDKEKINMEVFSTGGLAVN